MLFSPLFLIVNFFHFPPKILPFSLKPGYDFLPITGVSQTSSEKETKSET